MQRLDGQHRRCLSQMQLVGCYTWFFLLPPTPARWEHSLAHLWSSLTRVCPGPRSRPHAWLLAAREAAHQVLIPMEESRIHVKILSKIGRDYKCEDSTLNATLSGATLLETSFLRQQQMLPQPTTPSIHVQYKHLLRSQERIRQRDPDSYRYILGRRKELEVFSFASCFAKFAMISHLTKLCLFQLPQFLSVAVIKIPWQKAI